MAYPGPEAEAAYRTELTMERLGYAWCVVTLCRGREAPDEAPASAAASRVSAARVEPGDDSRDECRDSVSGLTMTAEGLAGEGSSVPSAFTPLGVAMPQLEKLKKNSQQQRKSKH